jgi:hypothetical protein
MPQKCKYSFLIVCKLQNDSVDGQNSQVRTGLHSCLEQGWWPGIVEDEPEKRFLRCKKRVRDKRTPGYVVTLGIRLQLA